MTTQAVRTIRRRRATWRPIADWAKRHPGLLRAVDWAGRGRNRLRLDRFNPPPAPRLTPDLSKWNDQDLAACWIGHATVLLRLGGINILTDPVFSSRIGLCFGPLTCGPRRLIRPAVHLKQLPPIDLILLSHAHFDHLDRPTLARLDRRTTVVTAPRTTDLVRDLGYRRIHELRWGEALEVKGVSISAVPVRHWGARLFIDAWRGYNAYLLQAGPSRILYAADTAWQEEFAELPPVDLMIVGIAAYDPYIAAHANPEQAWTMTRHARARWILPMHHSTFRLSHEAMDEPMRRFMAAAGEQADRIVIREVGQQWGRQSG